MKTLMWTATFQIESGSLQSSEDNSKNTDTWTRHEITTDSVKWQGVDDNISALWVAGALSGGTILSCYFKTIIISPFCFVCLCDRGIIECHLPDIIWVMVAFRRLALCLQCDVNLHNLCMNSLSWSFYVYCRCHSSSLLWNGHLLLGNVSSLWHIRTSSHHRAVRSIVRHMVWKCSSESIYLRVYLRAAWALNLRNLNQ